jgi:PAS domain S-box-containing protein
MIPKLTADEALDSLLKAIESAGIGCTVVIDDEKDTIERVYANAPIERLLGVDANTLLSMPPMDFVAPSESERIWGVRNDINSGRPAPAFIESAIITADRSTTVLVELGIAHVPIEKGRAVFVFIRDISEKVKIESALRDSERRFRTVAEASPDSITILKGGRYEYANPAALRRLGVSSVEDIEPFDSPHLFSSDRRDEILAYMARVRRGENVQPLLTRRRVADGKEVLFETSMSTLSLDAGESIISYSRDITERTQLQAELMKHDRLASVGILAAGVAHELNNPLMTVSMQAHKLAVEARERDLPADIREGLEQIEDAAKRLSSIIGDLLSVARPSDRTQAHVDVAQILGSSVALFRAGTLKCPPIKVTTAPLPPICGQASKLGQVILNVLRNAAQALEAAPDGGEIRVRAAFADERIVIEIEDDGPGIHADDLPRITQPFFTTKHNGTGLGLWISHTLIVEHGGTLDISSTAPRGTRVTIRLPTHGAVASTPVS